MRRWEAVSQFSLKRLLYNLSHSVVLQGAASSPSLLINPGVSLMTLYEKPSLHTYLRHNHYKLLCLWCSCDSEHLPALLDHYHSTMGGSNPENLNQAVISINYTHIPP